MHFTRQFDQMDCGPACIRMVADYFGKNFPLSYLRTLSHLTREGVSVSGIRHALEKIGIQSATFELTADQLREKCPLPAILHWDQNHFVVIYDVKKKRLKEEWTYRIANPAYGKASLSQSELESHWLNGDKGVVIALEPTPEFYAQQPVREKHSFFSFARRYVFPYKWQMIQMSGCMIGSILLSLATPFLTQALVDDGIEMKNLGIILNLMLAQLVLFLSSFVMGIISSWVSLYMGTRININILRDYLIKLLRLPMTFFDTKSVGDYQQRLSDHSRLQNFITVETLQTAFSLLSVPALLLIIGWYSPVILLVYLLLTAAGSLWMIYFFRKRKAIDYEQFQLNARNQNKLFEMMNGITDIKLNGYEDYKIEEWNGLQEKQYKMSRRILKLGQIQSTGFMLIGQLRNIFITFWIAADVVSGGLTMGIMMSISNIIGQVNGPLSQLIGFLQQFQDAKISLERSEEVKLCADEDFQHQSDIRTDQPLDIHIRHLTFSYSGSLGKPALRDINIRIPAGKMTAIVGESGSGKTTLMKLLLKFYEPTAGEIFWGESDSRILTAKSIRKAAGIVMQENFVFSDTIRNNIILGEMPNDELLSQSLHAACLEDFVRNLPLGTATKIGSEGIGISGGEKQRLMIARAFYKQPLYLLMDEATSSLDAENEQKITDNLDRHFQHHTRIIIAHRLSTVKNADNIIVLKNGSVAEEGTHADLIRQKGYYFQLVQNQLELPE